MVVFDKIFGLQQRPQETLCGVWMRSEPLVFTDEDKIKILAALSRPTDGMRAQALLHMKDVRIPRQRRVDLPLCDGLDQRRGFEIHNLDILHRQLMKGQKGPQIKLPDAFPRHANSLAL